MQRKLIIGCFGGDKQPHDFATQLGAATARSGCILLTGGQPSSVPEVKNQAMTGACQEEEKGRGAIARVIGIIPSPHPQGWQGPPPLSLRRGELPSNPRRLFLDSECAHNIRNVINAETADVVVAFGGGAGTLAEVAFSAAARKPLFFHAAKERLSANLQRYFAKDESANTRLYLEGPLQAYPELGGRKWSSEELLELLAHVIGNAEDSSVDADTLVARCISKVPGSKLSSWTGFPGLPSRAASKERFEQLILGMSR